MEWYSGPVSSAIGQCKQNKGVLIVFVKDNNEDSSTFGSAFTSEEVSKTINGQSYVAIEVNKESQDYKHFTALYPVAVIPSVFFINSESGFPLQIIRGSTSVSDLVSKMKVAFEKHAKLLRKSASPDSPTEPSQVPPGPSHPPPGPSPQSPGPTSHPSVVDESTLGVPTTATQVGPLSKEEKVKRAEELLKQKREQREREEFQRDKDREIKRRSAGKEMADAVKSREERSRQTWMHERMKAREEERKAKADILAKLEQDKEERRKAKEQEAFSSEVKVRQGQHLSQDSPPLLKSRSSGMTRLQFRLHDGASIPQEFNSSDPLLNARTFIAEQLQVPLGSVSLSATFPSRLLPDTSDKKTLSKLGLCPSSTIIVRTKNTSRIPSIPSGGVLAPVISFFAWILSVIVQLFKSVASIFTSSGPQTLPEGGQQDRNSRQLASDRRFRQIRQGDGYDRDGEDDDNDDERRKTDNGNSTQQQ